MQFFTGPNAFPAKQALSHDLRTALAAGAAIDRRTVRFDHPAVESLQVALIIDRT
jgi:hypothetical protein